MNIRTRESSLRNLKGRSVVEFQRNMASNGWPKDIPSEAIDRIRHFEKKTGRPIQKSDLPNGGKYGINPVRH